MSSLDSKTVIVLDHTHWMREKCGISINIDFGGTESDGGQEGPSPGPGGGLNLFPSFVIPAISKSLWSCTVESVLEYVRVVFDLFGEERPVRIALCQGQQGQLVWINDWKLLDRKGVKQQSLDFISDGFANAGPPLPLPPTKATFSSVGAMELGIKSAIEALSQPTHMQLDYMNGSKRSNKPTNKGRVICITSCTPDSVGVGKPVNLMDFFLNALTQHNRIVTPASDHLLPIAECEFILVSIHPVGKEHLSRVHTHPMRELSPILKAESRVVSAGDRLTTEMLDLCKTHHDLATTTITGIPMHESSDPSSKSNCEVLILHPKMTTTDVDLKILKWFKSTETPETVGIETGCSFQHHSISACKFTLVDFSRESLCVSKFVCNGRSIWLKLEMSERDESACSYLLTCKSGEMWIYCVETGRADFEGYPSISEGPGGSVEDYRIDDFVALINRNMLIPYPQSYRDHTPRAKPEKPAANPFARPRSSLIVMDDVKKPIEMTKARLNRKTAYWPLTHCGFLLATKNEDNINELLTLMPKDTLSDVEKVECDKCIRSLTAVTVDADSSGNSPINLSADYKKGKITNDETVYAELEAFIRANQHSENHKKVLNYFLDSRSTQIKTESTIKETNTRLNDSNIDKALAELAKLSGAKSAEDSTPRLVPSKKGSNHASDNSKKKNLLEIWTDTNEKKDSTTTTLTDIKLYQNLSSAKGDSKNKKADGK